MNLSENLLLYLVTHRRWLKEGQSLAQVVEEAIQGGVTCVQLREKHRTYREFLQLALQMKPICKKYNVPFIINDNVDIALAVDADGVHIGQDDMGVKAARAKLGRDKIIGTSAHSVAEALQAVADGADYIGCGAVFGSATKTDAGYMGLETLVAIRRAVDIPMVAIGGITGENIRQLAGTGVDGAAVVSAILGRQDVSAAAGNLRRQLEKITE